MANRSYKERSTRKIQQSNGTYYITIPKELMGELGWREAQNVLVTRTGTKLVIQDK